MQLTLINGDSGTSLTIGAEPLTGRIKVNGTQLSVRILRLGILEYLSRSCVYFGNFPVRQTKLALPFTVQPKFPGFFLCLFVCLFVFANGKHS